MVKRKTSALQMDADKKASLKDRLEETQETLDAIRQYMVDAFVVTRENGVEIMTLNNADFPYRMMVESMNEGAITLIPDGTIFYCNPRFSEMVKIKYEKLIGIRLEDLIQPDQQKAFKKMLNATRRKSMRGEYCLQDSKGKCVTVQLSAYQLHGDSTSGIAVIATDITERLHAEEKIRTLASELANAEQVQQLRISQVLHDDLQQRLFAVRAQLSMVDDSKDADGFMPPMRAYIRQAMTWLSDAILVTRNLSVDISPSILRGEGMYEAIRWLASRMKTQHGLQVTIDAKDNFRHLPDHVRVTIFQAVRELLFNVVKHSKHLDATVTLEKLDGHAHITIADEGQGFDVPTVLNDPQAAHGLMVIRDRLELMGGSMSVESDPGKGTRISMKFPVDETKV